MAYETALELLTNASIFAAVSSLYTELMGAWWILILFIATLMVIYIVSKSEGAVAAFGILGSAWLLYKLTLIPVGMQGVLYTILALSIAMLLYKVFGRGE